MVAGGDTIYRAGVPPESIWVTSLTIAGNLKLNGKGVKVFADDTTNAYGRTRITIPSFSGCGVTNVTLTVSESNGGVRAATVRTTDTNADGVTTTADQTSACDLNYNGVADDAGLVAAHLDHWHRNALHGTLVRRSTTCGTCPPFTTNVMGASEISWSPDGRKLAFTIFIGPTADCAVHLVPSDPKDGNAATQFTFPPSGVHDYDPFWSPLGTEIAYDRGDRFIYRRGIAPGRGDILITQSNDGSPDSLGDVGPAISPDGRWVAFGRKATGAGFQLWKIPIEGIPGGATPTQLTFITVGDDFYPQWSPDGKRIIFQRFDGVSAFRTYRISAGGGTEELVLGPIGSNAATPAFSPDGQVVLAGVGPDTSVSTWTLSSTFTGQTNLAKAVPNYPTHVINSASDGFEAPFPILSPRVSPDGTRLALRASPPGSPNQRGQLWAARRNMSLPPTITSVGGLTINDATPFVDFTVGQEANLSLTVVRSDPEGDAIADSAFFLRPELGMTFNPATRTLSWPVGDAPAATYTVRFQSMTPSGGMDYALARIQVLRDSIPPARVTDLAKVCYDGTYAELRWTAPADDSSFASTGPAALYDLRQSTAPINTDADFNAAPSATPPPPQPAAPGTLQSHFVTGLTTGVRYYFRMKTQDESGNWSVMSNQLTFVAIPQICGEGFAGGGGGGGGSGLLADPEAASLQAPPPDGPGENSLLEGVAMGTPARDALRLPGSADLGGGAPAAWMRVAGAPEVSVDRAGLLAVDHSGESRAYLLNGAAILGQRIGALQAVRQDGTDITPNLAGSAAEPYHASPGESVVITLAAAPDAGLLVLEGRRVGTVAAPESSGILVQAPDGSDWRTVADHHPRRHLTRQCCSSGPPSACGWSS